jgi:hypothetical protein
MESCGGEMSTTTRTEKTTARAASPEARVMERILREGYGPGAWHGADLKAAVAEVPAEEAFWRPAKGRHNVAEIALHHAYCLRSVRGKLGGAALEPFVVEGDDWFELDGRGQLGWPDVQAVVEAEQEKLARIVADIAAGRTQSPLPDAERLDLVLGITCHAIYHAGQIQLLKRLRAGQPA